MSKSSSLSYFAARLQTQFDGFQLKRQAMNPKAHPGADARLRRYYSKQGKIVDALYVRGGGLYVSRNPPSFGDAGKASSRYRKLVGAIASQFRSRGNPSAASRANQLGKALQHRPTDPAAAIAYGHQLQQLNLDLVLASADE